MTTLLDDYNARLERLIEALPSYRRKDNGLTDWALWTGELISAMQHAGASTKDIFETFLWEAGVIAGWGDGREALLSLEEAKGPIEDFSHECAKLIGPRPLPRHPKQQ
jgi:hypothetical protein